MEITNDFMEKMQQDPGRRRRGPVRAGAQGRAAASSSTAASPTSSASPSTMRRRRCAWRSRASKWATGSIPIGESRDVAVRLHPDDRVDASQHRAPADRGRRQQHDGAARPDRHDHAWARARRRSSTWTASARSPCRANAQGRRAGEVTADAHEDRARPSTSRPATASSSAARRATSRKCSREMVIALIMGIARHVPGAGDAVRLVHRAAAGDAVAAAVADRRGAGAAAHAAARST